MEKENVSVSKGSTVLDASGEKVLDYSFNQFEKYKIGSIPTEVIDNIVEHIDKLDLKWEKALYGSKLDYDPRVRQSDIAWISDEQVKNFVLSHFESANQDPDWQFDIDSMEDVQYTVYNASEKKDSANFLETLDGHYEWHNDHIMTIEEPRRCRKLSMSILLNQVDEDYEGGRIEFQVLRQGNIDYDGITLNKGDILVFPSTMSHRVAPVVSGTRKVLVAWAWGLPCR
jgi:PKHD-type hydroxylase